MEEQHIRAAFKSTFPQEEILTISNKAYYGSAEYFIETAGGETVYAECAGEDDDEVYIDFIISTTVHK